MNSAVIEVSNLSKYYGKQRGIEGVSFTVEEGELYGFIGPNGAGKTTTIRSLLALIHPTAGSASIFGKDAIKEAHQIAREVGYLPSEAYYYEHMKVKELLQYTADLYKKDCRERIDELVERLRLDINRKISDLSFGNKKKVGIVAALLHNPRLLLLDEPTVGLDPLIKETFFNILNAEKEKGTTILYSSHVLSEVQRLCNRVAIIKEGTVIQVERISELRKNGYKKIGLTTSEPVPNGYFQGEHIADYTESNGMVRFLYQGDVARLVHQISQLKVTDVFIEEPELEEIFLHYYR